MTNRPDDATLRQMANDQRQKFKDFINRLEKGDILKWYNYYFIFMEKARFSKAERGLYFHGFQLNDQAWEKRSLHHPMPIYLNLVDEWIILNKD